jgi:outer membrane receptor protein involved in Fe transport
MLLMTVVLKLELQRARTSFAVLCLIILFCASSSSQQPLKFSGVIRDSAGAPIPNASIELRSNNDTIHATSDSEGTFTVISPNADRLLVVSSPGFMTVSLKLTPEMMNETIRVRLDPAPLIERLEISSTEVRIPPTPTSQYSISRHELEASGALTIDDVLRQVPGFSLFRRSGSLVANPTSQGVSLRGVGASGASRALVLLDGIPLNNALGGWVYWTHISRTSIESLDTYNGATSDLYGSGALGGVINLRSRSLDQTFLDVETSIGNRTTPSLSLDAGRQFGGWGLAGSFLALRTDGYILVPDAQRGTVDTPAGTSDLAGSISLSKRLSHEGRAFLRLNLFGESRRNGTPLQINDTRGWSIDSGSDWTLNRAGDFSVRIYGSSDNFNQNFSAVAADRKF